MCGLFKTVDIAVNAVQDLNRAASVVVYHGSRALSCSIRLAEHREQDSSWTYSECPREMASVLAGWRSLLHGPRLSPTRSLVLVETKGPK